jgi:hypothetical protein
VAHGADIQREIVTLLAEWFEQTDSMLVAAEDAEAATRMVTDEDDTDDSGNDSDYNSVDDDDGKPSPKTEVPSSYEWYHFSLEAISIRNGWLDQQEKFHRDLGHDKQKFTGKQWATKLIALDSTMQGTSRQRGRDSDDKRNARTPSQTPVYVGQRSLTEHTRQTNLRQTT